MQSHSKEAKTDEMEMFGGVGGQMHCVALQMREIIPPDGDFNNTLNPRPQRTIGRQVLPEWSMPSNFFSFVVY